MRWPARLNEIAERQHGLVSRSQARDAGIPSSHLSRLGSSSGWEDLGPDVLRRAGSPFSAAQELLAGVLAAGPGAVLSHLPAGRHWGLDGCRARPVEVVRTNRSHHVPPGVRVHVVRALPDSWVTTLDSIPVVRPELLALHLFAVCSEGRAERLVESLWGMRLLSGESIARFLDEHGRRGRNGTAPLRRYLRARGSSYTPAASGVEARVLQVLRDAGLPMRRQVDSGGGAWSGRVDLRDPELPLVVEVQSERYHSALVDRIADEARVRRLEGDGFVVVEVTDTEVWTAPGVVVERVSDGRRRAQRTRRAVLGPALPPQERGRR